MAGAGVARDLALRGASVALFEKGDFASGTSSKSSKLIHGGLRYLELGDFKLVRESLREKKTLERLAPHLVRPLPFLVPVYRGAARGLITVRLGMWLYDLLTPGKSTERYRVLRPEDALVAGAERPRGGPARGRLLLRRPARSSPSASASRTCCRRRATARASTTTARSRRSCAGARGPRRRAGARSPHRPGARVRGPRHRQLRRAVGGPACASSRASAERSPRLRAHHQGHPLPAAAHDRPRGVPVRGTTSG